jgi:hypothetical protein
MEIINTEIETLLPFPNNPRRGNVKKLKESLQNSGQYKPIVVQASTRYILAGNHLWEAAKELGWATIDVVEVDVDNTQAKKIVASDNRLGELGSYDEKELLDLLQDISLEGTGYDTQDIDDLLALLEESSSAPAFDGASYGSHVDGVAGGSDLAQEGVNRRPTLSDRAAHYAERTVRLLMCEFPNHQYIWVQDRLTELRTKYNVDSNGQAILRAIADATESEVPSD